MDPKANPSVVAPKSIREFDRIPMSVPQLKLAVPDVPGYHLHWMLGTPERLERARRAGYVFVSSDEVDVNNTSLADDRAISGNTDMGSQVSIVAGGDTEAGGQPTRLILMKLRIEWWNEDQRKLEENSDRLAAALRAGEAGGPGARPNEEASDRAARYTGPQNRNMFQRRA